jgi:hypothetical protein
LLGCDSNDERTIEQVWEKFQPELEAKVTELAVDPVALRLAVTRNSESDVWELQAALHLTTRTLVADNVGESLDSIFGQTVVHLLRAVDEEGSRSTEASRRLQGLQAILRCWSETVRNAGAISSSFFLDR